MRLSRSIRRADQLKIHMIHRRALERATKHIDYFARKNAMHIYACMCILLFLKLVLKFSVLIRTLRSQFNRSGASVQNIPLLSLKTGYFPRFFIARWVHSVLPPFRSLSSTRVESCVKLFHSSVDRHVPVRKHRVSAQDSISGL